MRHKRIWINRSDKALDSIEKKKKQQKRTTKQTSKGKANEKKQKCSIWFECNQTWIKTKTCFVYFFSSAKTFWLFFSSSSFFAIRNSNGWEALHMEPWNQLWACKQCFKIESTDDRERRGANNELNWKRQRTERRKIDCLEIIDSIDWRRLVFSVFTLWASDRTREKTNEFSSSVSSNSSLHLFSTFSFVLLSFCMHLLLSFNRCFFSQSHEKSSVDRRLAVSDTVHTGQRTMLKRVFVNNFVNVFDAVAQNAFKKCFDISHLIDTKPKSFHCIWFLLTRKSFLFDAMNFSPSLLFSVARLAFFVAVAQQTHTPSQNDVMWKWIHLTSCPLQWRFHRFCVHFVFAFFHFVSCVLFSLFLSLGRWQVDNFPSSLESYFSLQFNRRLSGDLRFASLPSLTMLMKAIEIN